MMRSIAFSILLGASLNQFATNALALPPSLDGLQLEVRQYSPPAKECPPTNKDIDCQIGFEKLCLGRLFVCNAGGIIMVATGVCVQCTAGGPRYPERRMTKDEVTYYMLTGELP